MDVTIKKEGSVDVIEINGQLDVSGSEKAQEAVLSAITKDGKLVIDMSRCDYVASSGLRSLLIIGKQSAQLNCETVLAGVQPLVWDVIVMTGFEDVLKAYSTQEDAVAALK